MGFLGRWWATFPTMLGCVALFVGALVLAVGVVAVLVWIAAEYSALLAFPLAVVLIAAALSCVRPFQDDVMEDK